MEIIVHPRIKRIMSKIMLSSFLFQNSHKLDWYPLSPEIVQDMVGAGWEEGGKRNRRSLHFRTAQPSRGD